MAGSTRAQLLANFPGSSHPGYNLRMSKKKPVVEKGEKGRIIAMDAKQVTIQFQSGKVVTLSKDELERVFKRILPD